ncbi:conserved hypothetical protein [Neospora caninum Liverpool]|nr:conserved hypothetical protein [Neospora caninum Liverpool]CBZ53349.1 conserved hypothetical protein [Neospora caninum Liverpool]|eukprot:XP_003883381.1 conserved hypothetical protein [Neospora caninum Liverpool]
MLVNFVDPHFALTDASFAHSVGDEQSVQGICLDPAVQAILASDGVQLGSLRAECVFSKPTVASSLDQVTVTPAVCGCAAATTPPDQVSLQSFPRDALASASGNSVVAANALRSSLLNRTPFRHEPRSSSENVGSPDTTETARRSRASLDSSGVPPCLVCQYGCSNDPESRDATDAFADKIRVSIPASQVAPAAPPAEQPPFLPAGDASLPASQDSVVPLCRVVNKDGFLNHVVVAGAFDRLHAGHKILLMAAALLARQRVGLAVTSGSLISRKVTDAYLAMASGIEPFCLRSRSAAAFLALLLQASGRSCVFLNYTAQVLCEELGFSEGVLGKDSSEDGEQIERLWRDAYAQATQAWSCFSRAPCGDQAAAANCRLAESCFAAVWSDAVDFPALSACRGKDERGERNRDPGEHPVAICLYRIGDPLGPAGDLDFDALVVSAESVSGGQFVNAERAKRNHRPVLLVEIPTLPPANPGGIWKRDACSALETGGASREAPSHHRSTSHQKTETSQGGARSCTADVSVPAPEPAALARAQASTKLSSTTLRGVQALRLGVSREDLKLLFAAFHAAVSMLIGTPEAVQSAHWTVLCEMYSAPWRRFSTFGRLARLLRIVEETSGGSHAEESQGGRLTPQQQATVSLALLFAFAPAFPGAALRRQKVTVSALETPAGVGVQQAPGENASPIQAQHSLNCAGEPSNEAAFAHALLAGCFVDAASAECTRCAAMHFDLSSEALRLGPASEENNKTVRSMKFDTFSSVSACMNAARSACPFLLASPSGAQTDAMWNQGPVSKAGFPCSRSIQLAVLLDAAVPWPEYLNARAQPFMEENSFLSVHDYRRWRGNQIRVWLSQYCPEGDTRRLAALGLTQEEVERIVFNLKNELKMLSVCDPERVRRAYTPPD